MPKQKVLPRQLPRARAVITVKRDAQNHSQTAQIELWSAYSPRLESFMAFYRAVQ